jgi:hypothetical protein
MRPGSCPESVESSASNFVGKCIDINFDLIGTGSFCHLENTTNVNFFQKADGFSRSFHIRFGILLGLRNFEKALNIFIRQLDY